MEQLGIIKEGQQVSILILLDYLFLYPALWDRDRGQLKCFNPYFIGLPILIREQHKRNCK